MTTRGSTLRTALAYYNWGRWVADCPHPGCSDAREVKPPQMEDACVHGHPFRIQMPPAAEAAAIVAELGRRTQEQDRAWYPRGHARAELAGQPTGQTVAQLRAETVEVEAFRASQQRDRKDRLASILAEHGIHIGANGHFEGII